MSIRYIADADWEVVEKSTQLDSLGEDAKKVRGCDLTDNLTNTSRFVHREFEFEQG